MIDPIVPFLSRKSNGLDLVLKNKVILCVKFIHTDPFHSGSLSDVTRDPPGATPQNTKSTILFTFTAIFLMTASPLFIM